MTPYRLYLYFLCRLYRVCFHCGHVQEHDAYFDWFCVNCDMPAADAVLAQRYRVARDVRKERGIK